MKRPVRRVALYGYLGSGNIGNDASLETVLAWLKSAYPDVAVSCITIAPDEVAVRYRIPAVQMSVHSSAGRGEGVTETSRKLLGRLADVARSYVLAGSVDAVIVPGMGVLEESLGVRPWRLPLGLFLIAAACRLRHRPFVLLDVGAEYAANPFSRWLYVATVHLAAHVSYRDHLSAAAMARAGAREPEAVAPDLAFAHPAPTSATPQPGRLVVGLMAYYGQGDDPIQGAGVRRRYVAKLAHAIAMVADAGDQVVLVGGDKVDAAVASDVRRAVLSAFPALPEDAVLIRDCATFSELTEEMRQAEVVIASRFHNLISALRLARPTISIGYADKNRHLMDALGVGGYCQDLKQLNARELVAQIRAARENSEALTARIRQGTSDYAEKVESLLERLATETLGLPARRRRGLNLQDEMDPCHST
jgi:polysaccharide pyruvyl transferase WcaK-like protein